MIVVDSSALIAILLSEPEAHTFAELLFGEDQVLIGAPTRLEFLMVATVRLSDGEARAAALIDEAGIETAVWTSEHAGVALDAFKRFGRGRHPAALNFGDCMSYAVAKWLNAPLLFKGDDFSKTDIRSALVAGVRRR